MAGIYFQPLEVWESSTVVAKVSRGQPLNELASSHYGDTISSEDARVWSEELVQRVVLEAAAQSLQPSRMIDMDSNLLDAGMDSFAATSFCSLLSSQLQMPLPMDLVFQYPTQRSIVTFVLAQTSSTEEVASSPLLRRLCNAKRPKHRVLIFPALGQPSVAWRDAARMLQSQDCEVLVLTLPGNHLHSHVFAAMHSC
jgi:acyl carrier protein